MTTSTSTTFKIGDRIRVVASAFIHNPRRGVIASIHTNHYGTTIYVLNDGGFFSAKELVLSR